MTYSSYKKYEFTAIDEATLLNSGSGNGSSIGKGDVFTMPAGATVCIEVCDNDIFLSGDNYKNENANDSSGQTATIMDALTGEELGNEGQIYAEKYFWVTDENGNYYQMVEIEQEGSDDDYFAFYNGNGYGTPPEGAILTVGNSCNVKTNFLDYKCLDGGEKPEKDPWVFDEEACTYTVQAECWDLHNFKVVDGDQAAGGELVKIDGHDGKISTDFGGSTGVYNMTICVQDECDGESMLKVYVNGEFQQTVVLDRNTDGGGSNDGGFSAFTLSGLEIKEGDKVEIRAWRDDYEFVRIDEIKFEQVKFEECDLPGAQKLDFEAFSAGDILTDLDGLTISATGGSGDAMVFDSQNPTGGDSDLETQVAQLGNVLIISEDGDQSDPDDVVGGTLTFDFDNPSTVFDLKFIDTEEGGTITLTLEGGGTEIFDVPNLVNGGVGQVVMNVENVVSMEVALNGSGAIDDLCWVPGEPPTGTIGGRYFCDENRNDIDDGEPGVANAQVDLLDANGNVIDTTFTDSNGDYCFEDVAAGTYSVRFQDPDAVEGGNEVGKTFVDPNAGNDDEVDSDVEIVAGDGETAQFTLAAGEEKKNIDAGIEKPTGTIGGRYFCDENRDDTDNNEPGVAGAQVDLLDVNGNVIDTTFTDSNGDYCFEDVEEGTYSVRFQDPDNVAGGNEVGKTFVDPNAGTDDEVDSDVEIVAGDGETAQFSLAAGEEKKNVDAGIEKVPGSLSGRYFCDEDGDNLDNDGAGNGVAGVMVALFEADGVTPATDIDGTPVMSVLTAADGSYSFGNLEAGDYTVMFTDTVSGGGLVDPNVGLDDTIDSDALDGAVLNDGVSTISAITVVAGANTPDNDAGVKGISSVGDTVWFDENRDGTRQVSEALAAGVAVTLLADLDGGGVLDDVVATATTDADGQYLFDGLKAGDYRIEFGLLDGFEFTTPGADPDDETNDDSDAGPGGLTDVFSLEIGEAERDIDAGLVRENDDPEPMDDALTICADEEGMVDVLDNDSDPDGDTLTITMVDGQAIIEGGPAISTGAGTMVSLVGGKLVIDAEAAYASLDITDTAMETISYTVDDGEGGMVSANLELTVKGDANSTDSLAGTLPSSVKYKIADGFLNNPVGDFGYDMLITEAGGDTRFENVTFTAAYCLDFDKAISTGADLASAPELMGDLFAFNDTTASTVLDVGLTGINGAALDNVNEINWIMNQQFEIDGTGSIDGNFTGWEVQFAIWELTNGFDSDFTLGVVPGIGQVEDVDYIVNRAINEGFDFIPGVGDVFSVAINPNPASATNEQPFIIGLQWEDFDCLCIDNNGMIFDSV